MAQAVEPQAVRVMVEAEAVELPRRLLQKQKELELQEKETTEVQVLMEELTDIEQRGVEAQAVRVTP
jgi:hypothetical protein